MLHSGQRGPRQLGGIDRYLVTGRTARDLIFGRVIHGAEARYADDSITVLFAEGSEIKYTHATEGDLRRGSNSVGRLATLLRETNGIDDRVSEVPIVALAMRIMYDDLPWSDALTMLYQLEEDIL